LCVEAIDVTPNYFDFHLFFLLYLFFILLFIIVVFFSFFFEYRGRRIEGGKYTSQ